MNYQEPDFEGIRTGPPHFPPPVVLPGTILKEIRSWAIALLVLGVLHIFASGFLSAPWGITLIVVGLASFYIRSSAMMVVYAVTLAWAGIHNLSSGQAGWIGFAIFQWFLAVRVFLKFRSFRRVEADSEEKGSGSSGLTPQRSASIFPWAAGALGAFSLLGLVGVVVGVILLVLFGGSQAVPEFMIFVEGLVVNCGVLGLALGLASLLCKHPRKAVAIVGMVTGVLTLLIETVLSLL
jgi:hypothetical protein